MKNINMKYFEFRKGPIKLGILAWFVWLPANIITSAIIYVSNDCGIEATEFVRWLKVIYQVLRNFNKH